MMNLDEAIQYHKEKAEELRQEAEQVRELGEHISNLKQPYNENVKYCLECANEHEQLAKWLKELKALKERPQGEWKHLGGDEWVCSECGHVITTEGSWENPLSTGAYHCENCGADMRKVAEE